MTKPVQKGSPTKRTAPARKTAASSNAAKRAGASSPLMALHRGVVYGPIKSRRLGRSLGINLTPAATKLCSFNCSYCQYGWSEQARERQAAAEWPSPAAVARAVLVAAKALAARGEGIDRLTLAGHGEPTMHPDFAQVVDALLAMRDKDLPGVPIAILSNASTLDRADVRAALGRLDERYMKLDAGDAATLRAVNGSTQPIAGIIDHLREMPDITVQAMFVKDRAGRVDNSTEMAVISWVTALRQIKPKAVHIYTIDRAPAWPYLLGVPAGRLQEIGQRVRQAGLTCEVFPPVDQATPRRS